MSSDVTYDEVLPERATVPCAEMRQGMDGLCIGCGADTNNGPNGDRPARAGDTIEVPCPECGGSGSYWSDEALDWVSGRCSGAGTVRVRLTEDPTPFYEDPMCPPGKMYLMTTVPDGATLRGWRHVGTVVTP